MKKGEICFEKIMTIASIPIGKQVIYTNKKADENSPAFFIILECCILASEFFCVIFLRSFDHFFSVLSSVYLMNSTFCRLIW